MKKFILSLCVVSIFVTTITSNLLAQGSNPNNIKLSIGLLNKVRLGYERSLTDKFSVGAVLNAYYGSYSGFKIEPFARFYFGSECPSGLYVQTRALLGSFKTNTNYYYINNDFDIINKDVLFTAAGGGLDIGYQWVSGGSKNIVVDISLGFQHMPASSSLTDNITKDNKVYIPPVSGLSFYTIGPAGIFNPHLSIGYAF